jgi:hypothetical protein
VFASPAAGARVSVNPAARARARAAPNLAPEETGAKALGSAANPQRLKDRGRSLQPWRSGQLLFRKIEGAQRLCAQPRPGALASGCSVSRALK